jgi:hypothetical protein
MNWIVKVGLVASCTALAFILINGSRDMFIILIVAPAIGMIGCIFLAAAALGSMLRPAAGINGTAMYDGGER